MSSGHTSPESMRTNDENARDFAACHGTRALPSVGVLQISQPSQEFGGRISGCFFSSQYFSVLQSSKMEFSNQSPGIIKFIAQQLY